MSEKRFIVKNVKLPIELNSRLETFKAAYRDKLLGEMGYNATHTDVIRYLIKYALDNLEPEFGIYE